MYRKLKSFYLEKRHSKLTDQLIHMFKIYQKGILFFGENNNFLSKDKSHLQHKRQESSDITSQKITTDRKVIFFQLHNKLFRKQMCLHTPITLLRNDKLANIRRET